MSCDMVRIGTLIIGDRWLRTRELEHSDGLEPAGGDFLKPASFNHALISFKLRHATRAPCAIPCHIRPGFHFRLCRALVRESFRVCKTNDEETMGPLNISRVEHIILTPAQ